MTINEINEKLELHKKWLYNRVGGQKADFSGMDLRGIDLSGKDLRGIDFSNSHLNNAKLYQSNLVGANLSNTILFKANLYGTNLKNADLYNADLGFSNLLFADLRNANLSKTSFYGANICNADFGKHIVRVYTFPDYPCFRCNNDFVVDCERCTIEEWKNFTDKEIMEIDSSKRGRKILNFYHNILMKIIDL